MKPCPECGGVLEKHVAITLNEPVITPYGELTRRARLATVYACTSCEHYEER